MWPLLITDILVRSPSKQTTARTPEAESWSPKRQNCSREPKWVVFDRDSESRGERTAVGARRHIRLHSGFWEDASPFPSCQKYISPMSSSSSFSSMSFSSSFYTKGRSGE